MTERTSFDSHRPPSRELLDDCVHCGFCLPTCPTYVINGEEMDSPRGRIYLMDLAERGEIPLDRTMSAHIDSCLGCLACVPACPSGVRYDLLIEAVRPQIERHVPRTRIDRLVRRAVFAVFPHPARLRVAAVAGLLYRRLGLAASLRRLGVVRRLPAQVRAAEELLPPVRFRSLFGRMDAVVPAVGERRMRVALLEGCAQRVLFGDVNAATARVLAAEGCEVVVPREQQCCGALSMHAGREDEAARRARRLIDTFERHEVDAVVVNVAGCGSSMKEYGELLRDDPAYADRAARFAASVRDVSEVLAQLPPRAERHRIDARIAYHDACHLGNAQGIRQQPRDLLRSVPGVEVTDIPEASICCGSAGIYNLVQPDAAEELGRRKAAAIESTAPDVVATANAGCLLQVRRFLTTDVTLVHPIQVVDAAIRGVPLGEERR
ncbi:(Fe-S)-binding protein [Jiangella asiatica]|uniref:Glycolate oxidase iron-sulfur subunit n=1 Tax=Jiangella asiatica TaxID=2530372 RepID=A0A4R5CQA8_9ACTN|nr:heterodisulfide reductase-related iron-sulfur binding cluster [Jiangella asiatica]TDE01627.1 4Fe-4S dicluster domain-containing protein [Jiangella asiatica]